MAAKRKKKTAQERAAETQRRSKAAKKAWKERKKREEQEHRRRSEASKKGWKTRKAKARKAVKVKASKPSKPRKKSPVKASKPRTKKRRTSAKVQRRNQLIDEIIGPSLATKVKRSSKVAAAYENSKILTAADVIKNDYKIVKDELYVRVELARIPIENFDSRAFELSAETGIPIQEIYSLFFSPDA